MDKVPINIDGFRDIYLITRCGNIYNKKNITHQMKTHISNGYMVIGLTSIEKKMKTFSVSRLVAITFIENPNNKPYVNHINGNKLDNNVNNLEWITQKKMLNMQLKQG